jgi:hypothetical protein
MTLKVVLGGPGAIIAATPIRYEAAFDYKDGHLIAIPPPGSEIINRSYRK